jgi:hypothetical protein
VNRLSWNEYPVMAAVAAVAGIGLFLLLQTIGSGPAGEQPLRRTEPTSANIVSPPFPSQVEAARQDRARQRAVAKRLARARARRAAAAAAAVPAASPRDYSVGSTGSQPYESGQQQSTGQQQEQQQPAPSPDPAPTPKPKAKQPAPSPGRNFDDSG